MEAVAGRGGNSMEEWCVGDQQGEPKIIGVKHVQLSTRPPGISHEVIWN